ncbi:MAG: exodeoxyribonuclease VII large subunit [Spirochaetaceae bacterium]|nr:exodeoxyribonuclease VII large subunit [Spirochaetaceae bacterium]
MQDLPWQQGRPPVLSVSELTARIRDDLESAFPDVLVEGELSNCKTAASGHFYFSLKDSDAVLLGVMFRRDLLGLTFQPKDGMKVRARGSISVYAARGQYQLIARLMVKAGQGDILAELEERKRRLAAEGLFDTSRKRPLPFFPQRIGVVTSPTGAAVRDIIRVLHRRNPKAHIIILPTLVQGNESTACIAARIRQANQWKLADVLIVGRGGGSLEDLLPFSDEEVVRAIAASEIPVISAVGHETDWSLSDFAADVRAPTPSAAAEMACADLGLVEREISQFSMLMVENMRRALSGIRERLARNSPRFLGQQLEQRVFIASQRFDLAAETMRRAMNDRLVQQRHRLELATMALHLADPSAILSRGYSIVRTANGALVRSSDQLARGTHLHITFAEGAAEASVTAIEKAFKSDSQKKGASS